MGERGVPIVQAVVSLTIHMMAQHEGEFVTVKFVVVKFVASSVTVEFVIVDFVAVEMATVEVVTDKFVSVVELVNFVPVEVVPAVVSVEGMTDGSITVEGV